jgi:hypothetical protein
MGKTIEECRKNYNQKMYHIQCLIPVNMGEFDRSSCKFITDDVIYRKWIRWSGYRKGRQALDAIRDFRRQNMRSWGYPWKFRIKIVK